MELRWTRECGSHRGNHLPNREEKRPAYRRSLSTLRSINKAEAQRKVDLAKLFEVYDTCMKDIAAELESPHLSKIDKADALIASIAATDILLNELGLEEAPLRELIKQLGNRRLGTPDTFSFDQTTRPNAVRFDKEVIRALIFALYEEKGLRREEAYKWAVECPSDMIDQIGGWATAGVGQAYGDGYGIDKKWAWLLALT